jgi:hypothetical protein
LGVWTPWTEGFTVKLGVGAEKRRPKVSTPREYIREVCGPLGDNGQLKMCFSERFTFWNTRDQTEIVFTK